MAFRHYALTLDASVQRLSDVYGDGVGVVNPASDVPCRQIVFAAPPGNSAVVYVGSSREAVSATSHAFSLDPTQASQGPVILGPFETGPMKLSDFYVLGTNAEQLMVGFVPF